MPRSYHGKILRVNLTQGTVKVEEPGPAYYRRYMGGWNIIADVLLREVPAKADPLGPKNKLVAAPGVLTGLPFPGSSRMAFGAKSPLTGAFGAAEVGGDFPAEFKHTGFDAVIVEGISPKPVYLWITDGAAGLRDASEYWGQTTKDTLEGIQEELGDKRIRAAMIGPGGENLVRYACVMCETKDAAGRTGLGAVMGSKRLKAIACRGTLRPESANPDRIREMAQWVIKGVNAGELNAGMHKYGTGAHLEDMVPTGNLPIHNFRDGEFPAAADISANTIIEKIGIGMEGCWGCVVRCKKVVRTEDRYNVDPAYGGPEYETIASLGSCVGVEDIAAISKANELCNAYSLDTISAGVTVAFAMECFENGLLTLEDTDGIELRFGSGDALVAAIEKAGRREGKLGALLAEGAARMAQQIGKGSERFAMTVKGQEFPMHEPRFKRGLAIGYAASSTGADHCHSLHDSGIAKTDEEGLMPAGLYKSMGVLEAMPVESLGPEKVRVTIYHSMSQVMNNCLSICIFVPWSLDQKVELVRAATGWDVSAFELLKVGERALTLARAFNAREGFTPDDDRLPERSYGPTKNGALADGGIDRELLHEAMQSWYGMMGWNAETGVPLTGKLQELDVAWAAEYLPK
jgi:aldehyde:ferredoxin oxidoreductase